MVVVWFLLGLLHFLASLVWGAVEVVGLVALVVLIGWLLFRDPATDRPPPGGGGRDPGPVRPVIDSNSSTCSATMRWVEK